MILIKFHLQEILEGMANVCYNTPWNLCHFEGFSHFSKHMQYATRDT